MKRCAEGGDRRQRFRICGKEGEIQSDLLSVLIESSDAQSISITRSLMKELVADVRYP